MKYSIYNNYNKEKYFLLKNPEKRISFSGGKWMIYPYLHESASYQQKEYKPIYKFSLYNVKKHKHIIEHTPWYLERPKQKQFYLKVIE